MLSGTRWRVPEGTSCFPGHVVASPKARRAIGDIEALFTCVVESTLGEAFALQFVLL